VKLIPPTAANPVNVTPKRDKESSRIATAARTKLGKAFHTDLMDGIILVYEAMRTAQHEGNYFPSARFVAATTKNNQLDNIIAAVTLEEPAHATGMWTAEQYVDFAEDALEIVHGEDWRKELLRRKAEIPILPQGPQMSTKKYVQEVRDRIAPFEWAIVHLAVGEGGDYLAQAWVEFQQQRIIANLCSRSLAKAMILEVGKRRAWGTEDAWDSIMDDAHHSDQFPADMLGTGAYAAVAAPVYVAHSPSPPDYPPPGVDAMTAAVGKLEDMRRDIRRDSDRLHEDLNKRIDSGLRDMRDRDHGRSSSSRGSGSYRGSGSSYKSDSSHKHGRSPPDPDFKGCFRCRQEGHYVSECKLPCKQCGAYGLVHRDTCRFGRPLSAPPASYPPAPSAPHFPPPPLGFPFPPTPYGLPYPPAPYCPVMPGVPPPMPPHVPPGASAARPPLFAPPYAAMAGTPSFVAAKNGPGRP
jgi:hypothetical protein